MILSILPWPVDPRGIDLEPALRGVATDEGGAAHVGDRAQRFALGQALGDFHHRTLGVAVEQDVGRGVHQDRAADLVLPVVVMGDTAQRGLDPAEDHRHMAVGLLAALAVDQAGAVRALAGQAAGGVGVVGTDLLVRGVAVDHRVHVAGRHAEEQVRLAELHEVVLRLPVRLGDDADAEPLGLQQAADDGHAEGRVVDVGIAGDDDDVAGVPAELIHLFPTHRQEGRRTETLGPVLGIVEQRLGGLHHGHQGVSLGIGGRENAGAEYSTKNEQFRRFHWVLPAVGRLRKNAIISPPSFYTPFIVISPGL